MCTQEASATVMAMRKATQEATIDITIECSNNRPRAGREFSQAPGPMLMKECDQKSHDVRQSLLELNQQNTPQIEQLTPMHKGIIKDKSINTLIREIDAQQMEQEYAKSKLPEH